jgi:hypothetical protein
VKYLAIAVLLFGLSACHLYFEDKDAPFYNLTIYYQKPDIPYRVIGLVNARPEEFMSGPYVLRREAYKMGGDAAYVLGLDQYGTAHAQIIKFNVP